LTALDVAALAAYCAAYQQWREAKELLADMARRDPTTKAFLVKRADGNAGRNPVMHVAAKAAADMVSFAGHFGMSPAARARISAGIGFEPPGGGGKFGDLIVE
jgi:P27 family predicted phage terminase small subunit